MCAAANPISILQEYAMKHVMPLPVYEFFPEGPKFLCRAKLQDIVCEAIAENKKNAKYSCAQQILSKLNLEKSNKTSVKMKQLVVDQQVFCSNDATNYVGLLNEFCSKNGYAYPNYVETFACYQQNFILRCELLHCATESMGHSKKSAKQLAAKEMLQRIESEDFRTKLQETELRTKLKMLHLDNTVVEAYKNIIGNRAKPLFVDDEKSLISLEKKESPKRVEVDDEKPKIDLRNEQELRRELETMKLQYNLKKLGSDPNCIVLRIFEKNGNCHTFIAWNECYRDAVLQVFRQAVNGTITDKVMLVGEWGYS